MIALYSVVTPLVLMIVVVVVYLLIWLRNFRGQSLLDMGALCVFSTSLYCVIPLASFILAGEAFTLLSDNRLYWMKPSDDEMVTMGWWQCGYLSVLAISNIVFRSRNSPVAPALEGLFGQLLLPLALATLFCFSALAVIQTVYGVTLNPSYEDLRAGSIATIDSLPLFLRQVTSNLYSALLVLKFGLVLSLLSPESRRGDFRKLILFVWFVLEIVAFLGKLGSRYETFLLLMAAVMAWDRLKGRLGARTTFLLAVTALTAFMIAGALRDAGTDIEQRDLSEYLIANPSNEFQAMFATGLDLQRRIGDGADLPPFSLRFSELYWPVPSQLLPFEKMDPSAWYVGLLGLEGTGVGFMFGVIPQSLIGFGIMELLLRAAALGWICARLHAYYLRESSRGWVTWLYLWLCLFSYYTYRQNTFAIFGTALVRVAPVIILFSIVSRRRAISGADPLKSRLRRVTAIGPKKA